MDKLVKIKRNELRRRGYTEIEIFEKLKPEIPEWCYVYVYGSIAGYGYGYVSGSAYGAIGQISE